MVSKVPEGGGQGRAGLSSRAWIGARAIFRVLHELDAFLARARGRRTEAPNDMVLRVFAQRRSGHHAIINWIRYHWPGRHWFLNHCTIGESPFRGADLSSSMVNGHWGDHGVFHIEREWAGQHAYKGLLVYNFEEEDFSAAGDGLSVEKEARWVGSTRARGDVLILRDPFNLLASKLKWAYGGERRPSKPAVDDLFLARDLWKVYAREFLRETRFLPDLIPISYNDWFSSRDYRDSLAERIGFLNRDLGIMEVAKWGPSTAGGSFDGLKYDGKAQDMPVLERWRSFGDDPLFRELCGENELHDLAREVFGQLPGTETLRKDA